MIKNEHDRIYLKNQAIEDLKKKFNLSSDATVEYDIVLTKLERVGIHLFQQLRFCRFRQKKNDN